MSDPEPAPKLPPQCPICGKPAQPAFRPFCSKACRGRDLLAWLGGRYAVPAIDTEEAEPAGEPPPAR